jgi:hypothetical protein
LVQLFLVLVGRVLNRFSDWKQASRTWKIIQDGNANVPSSKSLL